MPQFETGSAKLSISSIVAPQQTRVTTADDVNNLLGTVAKTTDDMVKVVDNETMTDKARRYNEARAAYQKGLETANGDPFATNEVWGKFKADTQALIDEGGFISEESQNKLQSNIINEIGQRELYHNSMQRQYEESKFKDSLAERAIAFGGDFKGFLQEAKDTAPLYRMKDMNKVSEFVVDILANKTTIELRNEPNLSKAILDGYRNNIEALKEVDPKLANKDYYVKALGVVDHYEREYRTTGSQLLQAQLDNPDTSIDIKNSLVDKAVEEGIVRSNVTAQALKTTALVKHNAKLQVEAKSLASVLSGDVEMSMDEYKTVINKLPLDPDDKRVMLEAKRIKANAYNLDVLSKNLNNAAVDIFVPTQQAQDAIDTAKSMTTHPLMLAQIESAQVKLNKRKESEADEQTRLILKNDFKTFQDKAAALINLYPDGGAEFEAAMSSATKQEMKKFDAKNPQYRVDRQQLDSFLKNDEHELGEKLIAIDNASFLTNEDKGAKRTALMKKYLTENRVEEKRVGTELMKTAQTKVNDIKAANADGEFKVTPEELLNTLSYAYPKGKATMPASAQSFYNKYSKEYDMYLNWKNGGDNRTHETFKHAALTMPAAVKQQLSGVLAGATTTEALQGAVSKIRDFERGNFIMDKNLLTQAAVAETMLAYTGDLAVEKWRKYQETPTKPEELAKTVKRIKDDIIGDSGIGFFEIDPAHPALNQVDGIAEALLKGGFNKSETKQLLNKHIDDNWIDVSGSLSQTNYVPKTPIIKSKDEYTSLVNSMELSFKKTMHVDKISRVYPLNYNNPVKSVWVIEYKDKDGITRRSEESYSFLERFALTKNK